MGAILVVSSLAGYQLVAGPTKVVALVDSGLLEKLAYATLGLILVGITMTLFGATSLLRRMSDQKNPLGRFSSLSSISLAISNGRGAVIFLVAAVSYGLLFSVISSSLVFQVGSNFSDSYGVQVPSIVPVVCCGTFGQMPQFVFYITQQFAILVIPINLILLFSVSWLVGINAASVSWLFSCRSGPVGPKWFGGLGAILSLFTACPTCAGFFFLSTMGLGGAATAALTLASLQGIFVLVGIPILVGALLLNSRQIRLSCNLDKTSDNRPGTPLGT